MKTKSIPQINRRLRFQTLESRLLMASDSGRLASDFIEYLEHQTAEIHTDDHEFEDHHDDDHIDLDGHDNHGDDEDHDHFPGSFLDEAYPSARTEDNTTDDWNPGSGQSIVERVTVQPIIVSNDDGSQTAAYFGNAEQEVDIKALVDQVWAQSGIDVDWLSPNYWNNTFANIGNGNSSDVRPTSDLDAIVAAGDAAGVGHVDPLVLDVYFVEKAAGFATLSQNTANGLAYVGANGITMHVGDNLVGFQGGKEVVARVTAHEIGHNLGLPHVVDAANLMDDGEQLTTSQTNTSLASQFSIPNSPPTIIATLQDMSVDFGSGPANIDLNNYFSDPDGDAITYSFQSSNSAIVSAGLQGSLASLTFAWVGVVDITVTATDSVGSSVQQVFAVSVSDPNQQTFVADVDGGAEDYLTWNAGSWDVISSPTTGAASTQFGYWSPAANWEYLSVGDFNGDGKSDIIGRTNGNWWIGISDGTSFSSSLWAYWNPTLNWQDLKIADFNGDGMSDIAGRTESGHWWVAESTGQSFTSAFWGYWPPNLAWENIRYGDFNGDSRMDVGGQIDGHWWMAISNGSGFQTDFWTYWSSSVTWTEIVVGDFNGDGSDDIAGRVNGTWWSGLSTGSSLANENWGFWDPAANWLYVQSADFNGDGRSDLIGRVGNDWYVAQAGSSSFTNALFAQGWATEEKWKNFTSGDFDGDGSDTLLAWNSWEVSVHN
ncbi:MAG: FG-GAP-like repeat-containing protein [Planctomycetota bacterium]